MAKKNITPKPTTTCDKCGVKPTDLLEYKELHLCFNCFKHEVQTATSKALGNETEQLEEPQPLPILPERKIAKTSRWVVANREVNINQFIDGGFSITTTRHVLPCCENASTQISTTTQYTPETLCLLVEALNKTLVDYNIDSNALMNNLKGESEIYQTFHDFKLKVAQ